MGRLSDSIGRALIAGWLVLVATSTPALAQKSAQQVVEDLNREAMEAYNALDINKAGSMLEEALRVASGGGVPPQLAARTNLNLGVVYIGGLGDQDNGLGYFVQAVCLDPSIAPDPLTSSPEIQNVFGVATQRARSGACPGAGGPPGAPMAPMMGQPMAPPPPPPPVAPPPDQALSHQAPPEQLSQTPLPLYVEVNPLAQAKKLFVYYKGLGMEQFKRVPMYQYQTGFAYQISCADVWEPKLTYYIEAQAADGRVVGVIASAARPIEVPVVAKRKLGEPALPGAQPPMSCVAKECPPGLQGCKPGGKAAIGDKCGGNSDCQSGLQCQDDSCALIGAGGTEVPDYNPQTGALEAPSAPDTAADFKPTFVQLGLTVGLAYVQAGMIADRPPPNNRIFLDQMNHTYVQDPFAAVMAMQGLEFPEPGTQTETLLNSWVPDADSSDSIGPLKGNCSADGVPSGPPTATNPTPTHILPTKYCVRVKAPGFVPALAMRMAVGHFITPKIALAALMRLQFVSGKGSLANLLLGARAEYLLTAPKPKGLMISAFAGATVGEIQAKPPAPGKNKNAPFVKSGLMGVHLGSNIRYRISPNFGLFAAPELDVQLPTLLVNVDLTLAGVEAAF
jgi:hypothetical protein